MLLVGFQNHNLSNKRARNQVLLLRSHTNVRSTNDHMTTHGNCEYSTIVKRRFPKRKLKFYLY